MSYMNSSVYFKRQRKCFAIRSRIASKIRQTLQQKTCSKKKKSKNKGHSWRNKYVYSMELPPIWRACQINSQLCDGAVICDDGTVFKIHRMVLSALSPYFKAIFTNSINRNRPENTVARVSAPRTIVEKMIDFAYTGSCDISHKCVEELMHFGDQYEFLGVVRICCEFLRKNLQPDNCIGIISCSRHYFCKELEKSGRRYALHNFSDVLKVSKEFLLLPVEDVIDILNDDDLNVRNEEMVFEGVKRWIEFFEEIRSKYILDLIVTVRMGNITRDFIQNEILLWQPVANSEACRDLIIRTLQNKKLPLNNITLISNPMFRPRIPHDVIFAVGGWTAGSPTNFMETYDTRADKWLLTNYTDNVARAYHGVCVLKGLIYIIGGFDGYEHFSTVRCLNPVTHIWEECACMHYARCYVSVAMHGEKIYAMGGYSGRFRMSSAERYDPNKNQWTMIQPMLRERSDASAAALGDKIYVAGGFNGTSVLSSAEVYDTLTNQWTLIPGMISARSGVSLIAFKDTIYALGGFDGINRLTSGEKFSPAKVAGWTKIPTMFTPRSNFAITLLDDYIFVIGGFNDRFVAGTTTINSVECFDVQINEWFEAPPMNLKRSALGACVVSGLKNARHYSEIGRNRTEMGQGAVANSSYTPISTERAILL